VEPQVLTPGTSPGPTDCIYASAAHALDFDGDGYLWAATRGGLVRWDPVDSSYTHFTASDGLGDNHLTDVVASPDGTIWTLTWSGVASVLEGGRWVNYDVESLGGGSPTCLAVSPGVVWIGTSDGRLYGVEGNTWMDYGWIAHDSISALVAGPDSSLWAGTRSGDIVFFDGDFRTTYTRDHGLMLDLVTSLAWSEDGTLWITTHDRGAASFDGTVWTYFDALMVLGMEYVSSVAVARDGAVWFGSEHLLAVEGKGAARYYRGEWTHYTSEDGLAFDVVTDIVSGPDGDIWLSTVDSHVIPTMGAISRYDGQSWRTYIVCDCKPDDTLQALAVGAGGVPWDREAGH